MAAGISSAQQAVAPTSDTPPSPSWKDRIARISAMVGPVFAAIFLLPALPVPIVWKVVVLATSIAAGVLIHFFVSNKPIGSTA